MKQFWTNFRATEIDKETKETLYKRLSCIPVILTVNRKSMFKLSTELITSIGCAWFSFPSTRERPIGGFRNAMLNDRKLFKYHATSHDSYIYIISRMHVLLNQFHLKYCKSVDTDYFKFCTISMFGFLFLIFVIPSFDKRFQLAQSLMIRFSWPWVCKWQSSGIQRRAVWLKFTDVSEELAASIIGVIIAQQPGKKTSYIVLNFFNLFLHLFVIVWGKFLIQKFISAQEV